MAKPPKHFHISVCRRTAFRNHTPLARCIRNPLAREQLTGYTGMVSVEMGSAERARRLVEEIRLFALAESLRGVESLIAVPAFMTHALVPQDRREAMGTTEGLVRISVGIADVQDLLEDLKRALKGV